MQNHNNDTIETSDTVFWKNIPLTLFERVVCERELETEQNCNILTLTLFAITAFLSRSPGLLNRGPGAHSAGCWLSLTHLVTNGSGHQTNWLPVFTELYNSSTTTFLWASQIALIQPIHGQGYNILIDWMHLFFYIGAFPILTPQPGRRSIYNTSKETSSNFSRSITVTFRLIPLGKAWNPFIPPALGMIVLLLFYKDNFGIE